MACNMDNFTYILILTRKATIIPGEERVLLVGCALSNGPLVPAASAASAAATTPTITTSGMV
jgi:hypothetical protein